MNIKKRLIVLGSGTPPPPVVVNYSLTNNTDFYPFYFSTYNPVGYAVFLGLNF